MVKKKNSGSHVFLLLITHLAREVACVDTTNCFLIFPLIIDIDHGISKELGDSILST